ncbi:MAG: TetR/AcrR family transcriptional regulator C-terminal domain-containing protein [Lachnospiraceae bacterium]|nr:TetR/AcrR family transcriptional regulator C-terminal domain-containing protein [Lachnospiraceae bacterium]
MSRATTKIAIAFAFKELLLEKPLDKITVNDITDKCGINRQTFYYHFHDILQLTEWICEEDADRAIQANKTYDTWQEGFLALFNMIKRDRAFIVNIYRNTPRDYLYRYLYKVTYQLLFEVLEEQAEGMVVRMEDKAFIANFYKYGFVGLVLEWIDGGMKEEPKIIIERLNSLIQGSFKHALENAKVNKL